MPGLFHVVLVLQPEVQPCLECLGRTCFFRRGNRWREIVGTADDVELGRRRRVADTPCFDLETKEGDVAPGDLVEPIEGSTVLVREVPCNPDHGSRAQAGGIGDGLAEVIVVGLSRSGSRPRRSARYSSLGTGCRRNSGQRPSDRLDLKFHADRVTEQPEVVSVSEPWSEIGSLVPPDLADVDLHQPAETKRTHVVPPQVMPDPILCRC